MECANDRPGRGQECTRPGAFYADSFVVLVALVIPICHIGRRKRLEIERHLQLSEGRSPKEIGRLTDELDLLPKIHDMIKKARYMR